MPKGNVLQLLQGLSPGKEGDQSCKMSAKCSKVVKYNKTRAGTGLVPPLNMEYTYTKRLQFVLLTYSS